MVEIIKSFSFFLGAVIGTFVGGIDGFMKALVLLMVLDYVTGVLYAIKKKMLSSEIGFWGLIKKAFIIIVVGVAYTVDTKVIGGGQTLRGAVILFYISNEGISLLENVSNLGVRLPKKLKEVLVQLSKDEMEWNKED